MIDLAQFGFHVITLLAAAAASYGAIRSDMRHLFAEVNAAKAAAERAHGRIDELLRDQAVAR